MMQVPAGDGFSGHVGKLWLLPLLTCALLVACGDERQLPETDGTYAEGPTLPFGDDRTDGFWTDLPVMGPMPEGADLDSVFEVVFAPDEPAVTLELEMMRRVRAECGTSSALQHNGSADSPCRIRYAVYNLRNPVLVEALADAADDGVEVQIIIDSAQLDPSREWNTAHIYLSQERGFSLALDQSDLTTVERESTNVIGITGPGLMHLKARIFETPRWSAVLSGSMNPGDNAMLNEENLNLIRKPDVVGKYVAAYEAVLHDRAIENHWDSGSPLNVLFTPAGSGVRAGTRILEWLAEEEEQILLMVFSLRSFTARGVDGSLIDILADRVAAGVPVYVITDRKQSDGVDANGNRLFRDDDTEDRLRLAGVTVYEAINHRTDFTAMHHKTAVLGRSRLRVITDASNWTFSGLGSRSTEAKNVESVLFIDSNDLDGGRTGYRYLAQWVRVLERYAHQSVALGEAPPLEHTLAHLMGQSSWPRLPVEFLARTETVFGETLLVCGDVSALGEWGEVHDGVELVTDVDSYPLWMTRGPVAMHLGLEFDWKLAKRSSHGVVSYESGQNRASRVALPALVPSSGLLLEAGWR